MRALPLSQPTVLGPGPALASVFHLNLQIWYVGLKLKKTEKCKNSNSHQHKTQTHQVTWSHSVVSNSLSPHELYNAWNSPGQNSGVSSRSLLQGIFPTQGSNPGLPHCMMILYQLSHKGSPNLPNIRKLSLSSSFLAKITAFSLPCYYLHSIVSSHDPASSPCPCSLPPGIWLFLKLSSATYLPKTTCGLLIAKSKGFFLVSAPSVSEVIYLTLLIIFPFIPSSHQL